MADTLLIDAFGRLMEAAAGPAVLRSVLATGDASAFWEQVEASGFLDTLLTEDMRLADVAPLAELAGYHLAPAAVCETMAARALLHRAGEPMPVGAVALGWADAKVTTVLLSRTARQTLIGAPAATWLVPTTSVSPPVPAADGLTATVTLDRDAKRVAIKERDVHGIAAALATAQMAGVARRLLEITVDYANLRQQFGKPIGKQQAIQQQLAVMAEKVVAIRMAGQMACACDLAPERLTAAAAKYTASAAVAEIAAIAHGVHGAIGLSEEHDLHLLTKRLHALRAQAGAESYWAEQLGSACFEGPAKGSVDFIRAISPV